MGIPGEMLDPCKRSPWQGGDGTQPVLGSPIPWDGVFPSRGTGAIPCQCCPGIPVVLMEGGWQAAKERQEVCLGRVVTPGELWLVPGCFQTH